MDGNFYAVKKILLDNNKPEECTKTEKEVKLLARLQPHHIVRYFQAWRENVDQSKVKQDFPEFDKEISQQFDPTQNK